MSNVDSVKRLYQAFAQGDLATVFDLLDPDIEWIESDGIPYSGVFHGHDAIMEGVFTKIGSEWDDFTADVEQYIDAGDIVVTLGTDSGTFKATGQRMSAPAASVWTFRNGKIVKFRQYIDTLAVVSATQP